MTTYDPQTDRGKGLLPPLIRAMTHVAAIISAHVHDYPMTVEDARAELDEAIEHVGDIQAATILSEQAGNDVTSWHQSVLNLRADFAASENENPENTIAHFANSIVGMMQQTWALGESLDRDLLGLRSPNETDAGRYA